MRIDELIRKKGFIITLEVNLDVNYDVSCLVDEFSRISDQKVDGVNITDMPGANLKMSPWAGALWAIRQGLNPIVQYTCRDRNSLALRGDILGLASFGVDNILVLRGDLPKQNGDLQVKAVFDMDTVSLIKWIVNNTNLCVGAAVNPGADDLNREIEKMKMKYDAGARFFQTQAIYDPDKFIEFMDRVKGLDVYIIAGIIPLKSEKMAYFMNEKIPGIQVPETIIRRIEASEDKISCGEEIAMETIMKIQSHCQGIHIMPIKNMQVALSIVDKLRKDLGQ